MRSINELVAALADLVGGVAMLAFLSLLAAAVTAALWYFWPRWLPRHWALRLPRTRSQSERAGRRTLRPGALRWRWSWRLRWRRRRRGAPQPADLPDDMLPQLPASALALTADELAAQGRYAESVRERLRAIVRDLVERSVIPPVPGWTVTELAAAATLGHPELARPLRGAVAVFSEIWYGLRPADESDDRAMRKYAESVAAGIAVREPAAGAAA